MGKVEILALAPGVPRTELAGVPTGSAAAAKECVEQLFPGRIGTSLADADLLTASYPEYGRIYAGTFGRTVVICGQGLIELADLAAAVSPIADGRHLFRLQVNSAIDSVALEILAPDGNPVREVMLVAEEGVIFDIGPHLDFEEPFWSGARDRDGAFAALNGSEMPFDAVGFGEEALRTLFGFVVDDEPRIGDLDAGRIRLHGFVMAADSADQSDMAPVRSGLTPPVLPDDDPVRAPGVSPSVAAAGISVTDGEPPDSAAQPWWQRLKRRLFG